MVTRLYQERQVSFIVAASCGNGKLDMTEAKP